MIKACAQLYDKIDIDRFTKVISLIKQKHKGHKAKKVKTLTSEEICCENFHKFCALASDDEYLITKVCFYLFTNLFHYVFFIFKHFFIFRLYLSLELVVVAVEKS